MDEKWAAIPGFKGYEISNTGKIFRVGKTTRSPIKVCKEGNSIYCSLTYAPHKSKQVNVRNILDQCFEDHIYKDTSTDNLEGEIWKDVVGWEDFYEVSNLGRVRTKQRTRRSKGDSTSVVRAKIKETYLDQDGYERLTLYGDNDSKLVGVHRLVAQAFITNPDNLPQVNHKNGNKADNKVENLDWSSCPLRK